MLQFERFTFDAAKRQVLADGVALGLGGRAFDVLHALIERRDRVVSKNELFDVVWPGLIVEENNLQVQISTLRKLLGPQAITTVPGRGYQFTLQPAAIAPAPAPLPAPAPSPSPAPAPSPGAAAVPASAAGNLPSVVAPLIGRDGVLRDLLAAIEAHALVTIVGAGGIGKTALAMAAANALRERYRDGVWWIELAPLTDPALLERTVAQTLRVAVGDEGARARLLQVLAGQRMLWVLDNCEHLLDAASALTAAVARELAGVHVLVTSQELLNVPGETVLRLDPLTLPAADEIPDVDRHDAVALFVQRARAVDPRFALGPDNRDAVADICRQLDGLPLAIELAAARVRLLGVHGVRERLGERFRMLTGGARTVLRRHQTLRTTIEWSYALLRPAEQSVLRRLGVFVGGFPLDLAQQVCSDAELDEWGVLDELGLLADKSLVSVDAGEPVRYRLLESTRVYALERLAEAGETQAMLRRHAHAVRDLFLRTDEERFGDGGSLDMGRYLDRLAPEIDNWRAALAWAKGDGAEPATALALAGVGGLVLRRLGMTHEALERLLPLVDLAKDHDGPSAALFWLRLAMLGDFHRVPRDTLFDALARALRLARATGSRRRLQAVLIQQAWALNDGGESTATDAVLAELASLDRIDDPVWLRAMRLNLEASMRLFQGRFVQAVAVHAEQRTLLQGESGEGAMLAITENNLALALIGLDRYEEAIEVTEAALARPGAAALVGMLNYPIFYAQVLLGRIDAARATVQRALPWWQRDSALELAASALTLLLIRMGRAADGGRVYGVCRKILQGDEHALARLWRARAERHFVDAGVAAEDLERWACEGQDMNRNALLALFKSVL